MVCSVDMQMALTVIEPLPRVWRMRGGKFIPVEHSTKEAPRYYTWDGQYAVLQVLKVQPWSMAQHQHFTVPSLTSVSTCYWCNREFPKLMWTCIPCHENGVLTDYCDSRCQAAACYPVHERRCGQYFTSVSKIDKGVASISNENIDTK